MGLAVSAREGDAPAMVFLHGGLGNRFNWRSPVAGAHQHSWRALDYDLAGHGSSSGLEWAVRDTAAGLVLIAGGTHDPASNHAALGSNPDQRSSHPVD